ncbi:hypothetical protein N7468_004131 [Penicillium chermesinum]|uniref:J domain-containing protein n=1 Tax=Penicillium chermesinum TaxID=63820 RepID=A0A9W9TSG6_9EURO|nr:uncharacterized protein N7468_004131 [Penicillium chermesinum]KAJ5239512.1 hypothetical protein N7468_004131 [Penicillium chermesinum]KAJ6141231.1 hypothetical protein N7470_010127 [Penicillium chermesinum]
MLKRSNLIYHGIRVLNSGQAPPFHLRLGLCSRPYATTSDIPSKYPWPSSPIFTPYDLLNLSRHAPYSKARYYELVKIYHPDRPSNDISLELRLQRYKLIVAAHEILSDPVRRRDYDRFGTGWDLHRRPSDPNFSAEGPDMTIFANATWEDWERWQARHHGKQQHLVDQRTFARLVILLVLLGVAVQASWLSNMNSGYDQRLREVSGDSMRFLAGRRDKANDRSLSRDARVQSFLISRDPTGSGLKDDEHPTYRKELHPRGSVYSSQEPLVTQAEDAGGELEEAGPDSDDHDSLV